ncbi:MAG: nickel pincer cofactor biosynthesis protein LarC [Lachnospiraceae bacterium]|nr:nickel pincer cofactor biosynthesis protein LarC [Lachnospiraceae bacterium]
MKTIYIDCGMGAAGDMLTAALLELLPDPEAFIGRMNAIALPGVRVTKEESVKCGIRGTHVRVLIDGAEEGNEHHHDHEHGHEHHHDHEHEHEHHKHHHSSMHEISHILHDLKLPEQVESDVLSVYRLIAEAESHVHNVPVSDIHFHEVGTKDAIMDITAVCLLMHELKPHEVIVSPVHVGSGQVKCAHGILPVPAPATACILQDIPVYGGKIEGELCTPTGAALLKHFATRFSSMPVMRIEKIGYGMGTKDFPAANCVRVMLGETEDETDLVYELSTNVDDMTAEEMAFATERLFENGALEVYSVPIGMKKSRTGTLLRVMCREEDREKLIRLLFMHTTTIGIRETITKRYVLDRKIEKVQTRYGSVACKVSRGYGVERRKFEYEDLARLAKENNISLEEIKQNLYRDDTI